MSTKKEHRISIIVPVFNRPAEVEELLVSLERQSDRDFEVVIVEDGSSETCKAEAEKFNELLNLHYYYKENSGPGLSRNYGYERASGNYGIFLDSDCILPERYIETVRAALDEDHSDAFGGPDRAHDSFTPFQKAVNYSMTSFFTTGGIRGGGEKMDKFYPRSFNMGYSREVFEATKGFAGMRFGEDIDMSIRILEHGFRTRLIKDAFVYHKRRTSTRQFFKQVFNSAPGFAEAHPFRSCTVYPGTHHAHPALSILITPFPDTHRSSCTAPAYRCSLQKQECHHRTPVGIHQLYSAHRLRPGLYHGTLEKNHPGQRRVRCIYKKVLQVMNHRNFIPRQNAFNRFLMTVSLK